MNADPTPLILTLIPSLSATGDVVGLTTTMTTRDVLGLATTEERVLQVPVQSNGVMSSLVTFFAQNLIFLIILFR
jgi:hypothetical protein